MTTDATPASASPTPGFLGILLNLYFSPSEAFAAILKRPSVWAPLLFIALLNASFTVFWLSKVDAKGFMKAQIEASGRMDKIPPEQREEVIEQQAKMLPMFGAVGPPAVIAFALIVAGVLTFIFRFFYASEVSFKQGLAISAWVFAAVGLVSTPLLLLTLFLKDDWTLNPGEVLQANPSLFFERGDVPAPVFSLFTSLDLFSFWMIALLALGFGIASRTRFGSAIWGVLVPWALVVAVKVGWTAMMG
jgi:hypothetical protein